MPKPKAPANTYWRGPVLWARFTVAGVTVRASLRTGDARVAARRVKELIEAQKAAAHFGETAVDWERAVTDWAQHIAKQVSAKTARRYATSLEQCRPFLTGKLISEIDRKALQSMVTQRRQIVSNATIKRDLTAVSSVLEYAAGQGWTEANPALVVAKSIAERRDPIALPEEASIRLLLARSNELWRGFIVAARLTGLRQDELCGIRRRDFDPVALTLYVPKAKGNRPRTIDLTRSAADVLAIQPPSAKTDRIFHYADAPIGNPSERFRHLVERAQKAAQREGVEFAPFRFHDLRHLYAVEYLRAGGSIYRLQQQLGHSSITTTEGYLRFLTPEQRDEAKKGA
jgi:integrase/recombinase XerD